MALILYAGLPGCGKTTLAAKLAYDFSHKKKYKKRYLHVYTNFSTFIDGVENISNTWLGVYNLENCAVIIDEATLWADSRDFKGFDYTKKQFILLHRHYKCDVYFFVQQFNALDVKIRRNIDRVYFLEKSRFFPVITRIRRVPYGYYIPDQMSEGRGFLKHKTYGAIEEGYRLDRGLISFLIAQRFFRPRYYKYFDSFERPQLKSIPIKEWRLLNPGKEYDDYY